MQELIILMLIVVKNWYRQGLQEQRYYNDDEDGFNSLSLLLVLEFVELAEEYSDSINFEDEDIKGHGVQ